MHLTVVVLSWLSMAMQVLFFLMVGSWFRTLQAQAPCSNPCDYQDAGPVNYCTYPGTGCPANYHERNGCCCYDYSPIIIDLDGDGVELSAASDGVFFDITGQGTRESVAWTLRGDDDGWLALDRNRNGTIDSGKELFGNWTDQPSSSERNGFRALAVFDSPMAGGNGDGVIDSRDAIFRSLRLWGDLNHNGRSEAGELQTLQASGVTEISLDYKESKWTDEHGNIFRYRTKVSDEHGAHVGRWAWDVFLKVVPPGVSVSRAPAQLPSR